MPIDANIAMGIKPIEQPNMLGQMAQAMAIRQANEEYQSSNALKDFYAQGGDLSKPEDQRKLMSTVGAKGADLIAKTAAIEKTKAEVKQLGYKNVESAFAQSREALSSINPSAPNAGALLMAWHEANHQNPVMGSILAASGIDAASSRATLEAAIAKGPAGIQDAIRRASMGQATYQKELMQTERSHIAAAPGHRNADIAGKRLTMDQGGTWASVIVGDRVMEHNNRTGEWREATLPESTGGTVSVLPPTTLPPATGGGGGAVNTPNALAPQPVAPTNALAPQPANAAPVNNALVQPPAATAPAPARQPLTTFNPKKVARETTNAAGDVTQYNERGEVIGVVPKAGKPSAAHEKELVTEAKKTEGQKTVQTLVSSLADQYKGLLQEGGITSTAKGSMSNISARSGSSAVGQFAAGFIGTKAQELRDSIAQTRPLIINAIKDSTGMSAQQLNSNVELQNFLKAATDPTLSIEANLKALNNISKLYGLGTEFTMADMKGKTPASTGNITDNADVAKVIEFGSLKK